MTRGDRSTGQFIIVSNITEAGESQNSCFTCCCLLKEQFWLAAWCVVSIHLIYAVHRVIYNARFVFTTL